MKTQKQEQRKQAILIRKKAFACGAKTASIYVRDNVMRAIQTEGYSCVSAYWPIAEELDPRPLMEALHRCGVEVCLPIVQRKGTALKFRLWTPGQPMKKTSALGGLEPTSTSFADPDLMIIPLLAFDRSGGRLGYGGGFYDRTIAAMRKIRRTSNPLLCIGVGFSAQERNDIPMDTHDQYLDMIVTEKEIIDCRKYVASPERGT